MEEQQTEIKIYVACLAAYTSGILHGGWIDAAVN
ncbi:MAG: antirestriction protein ArdA [Rhizobiaceae bacterium]